MSEKKRGSRLACVTDLGLTVMACHAEHPTPSAPSVDAPRPNRLSIHVVADAVQLDHRAVVGIRPGFGVESRHLLKHGFADDGTCPVTADDEVELSREVMSSAADRAIPRSL